MDHDLVLEYINKLKEDNNSYKIKLGGLIDHIKILEAENRQIKNNLGMTQINLEETQNDLQKTKDKFFKIYNNLNTTIKMIHKFDITNINKEDVINLYNNCTKDNFIYIYNNFEMFINNLASEEDNKTKIVTEKY